MPRYTRLLIFLSLFYLVPAYGGVEADLKERIKSESEGKIELLDFKPGKLVEAKVLEIETRQTPYTATLKFLGAGRWPKIPGDSRLEFKVLKKKPAPKGGGFDWNQFEQDTQHFGFDVAAGEKIKLEGVVVYYKENGEWKMGVVNGHLVK